MQEVFNGISNFFKEYPVLLKIISAVLILIAGFILIKVIIKVLRKIMQYHAVEKSLQLFLIRLIKILLYLLLLFIILEKLGIPIASLVAVIGTAGVAIGLALKDSLANFAGGILILLNKTYSIGDYIKISGDEGAVTDFDLLYTTLKTPDGKLITIPNNQLANSPVYNYSKSEARRCDLVFGISYENDINKAKSIIDNVVSNHPKIFKNCKDGANIIRAGQNNQSSIDIDVKVWCAGKDYFDVYYDLTEQIKAEFDAGGISIPYNQLDVHLVDGK